jgi:tetratricopeptide (TPR) repeat protein
MIEARDHYLAAQRLHEAEGEVRAEGMALGNLGEVLRRLGQNDAANDVLARALVLYRSVGYRRFEGMVLSRLGTVFAALGQTDQALATYAEAAQVLKETGYRVGETWAYVYRGKTLHAAGLLDEAVADFASALTFCRSIGYRPLEGVVLAELGWINLRRGQYDDAEANLHLSEGPLRAEAGPLEVAKMLCVRAQLRSAQGDRRAAGSDLDEACLLAGDLGAMTTSEIGALIHATRAVVEAA